MRLVAIVGARPQFIKASAISRAITGYNRENSELPLQEILLHTGQHYDENMSKVFFDELNIRYPDYNLGIGSGTHGIQTGRMLAGIEGILFKERPDWVIVYGDTNSTLAGALAARKLNIRVAHVEAGLRSFNRSMPEEVNRIVTDRISDLLFCPTTTAVNNLQNEGFKNMVGDGVLIEGKVDFLIDSFPIVVNVGDVMYDVSLYYKNVTREKSEVIQKLGLKGKRYVLATVHRAENTDHAARLKGILHGLLQIAKELPVVFPAHPRTREALKREGLESIIEGCPTLYFTPPLSYLDMVCLEQAAAVIITDSGGVQKEAFFYGVPCVTIRDETEWVETVEIGRNILAGTDEKRIVDSFSRSLKREDEKEIHPYGHGKAAKTIVACILGAGLS